ncbi:sigma-E factor negative regulatory protein [Undibacterium fentianense]|uniref:Sigma-E factor negative regulatory protein n=1 Tax=Undibacterium fentianense TaxID=2828728 RepID=A0A941IDK3_9BURK|nr:sigma-E factor negative regulatory protein [Undibacterium fentianense]MBR7798467.1 sigma-E factor negative regulatory protein [Undibacterium fentianense]
MNNTKQNESISGALDGELSDAQLDELLSGLKSDSEDSIRQKWHEYHYIGDALRSDDLNLPLSEEFSSKLHARLAAEPTVFVPKQVEMSISRSSSRHSVFVSLASIAATLILGVIMAPQLMPLLQKTDGYGPALAKNDTDQFTSSGLKLTSNDVVTASASAMVGVTGAKENEFAPKLENQVEMLRDPRLDSYLLAHQKVSPSLENAGRYVQRANVVTSNESKK